MAKSKKQKTSNVENKENNAHDNLAFELCETENITKTKSKEDISTLNKNLAKNENEEESEKPAKIKKKKFKNNPERIENDLFEEKPKKKSKKKRSSKKQKAEKVENQENIELEAIYNEVIEEERESAKEEINIVNDKELKKKASKKEEDKAGNLIKTVNFNFRNVI